MSIRQKSLGAAVAALMLAASLSISPAPAKAGVDPYLGDIMLTGYNFCPRGWFAADGQLLSISQHTSLFSLLGTTYGGDGRTTFGLPDLRGRTAMGQGRGNGLTQRIQGQEFGAAGVTMTTANLPAHSHSVRANNLDGNLPGPGGKLLAAAPPSGMGSETIYSTQPKSVQMATSMIGHTGGNQAISVADPSLVLTYCIATVGSYPSRP